MGPVALGLGSEWAALSGRQFSLEVKDSTEKDALDINATSPPAALFDDAETTPNCKSRLALRRTRAGARFHYLLPPLDTLPHAPWDLH